MIFFGIDNGVSGGLAAVSESGALIEWRAMPVESGRNGSQVDVAGVLDFILSYDIRPRGSVKPARACIEQPGGAMNYKAAVSMAGSYHALRAVLVVLEIPWEPVTPARWQKAMIPGAEKGETKPRALAAAKMLWPDESWITGAKRKAHDGGIDAALIAEYYRRLTK